MNVKRGTSQPKSRRSAHTTQSRRSLLLERLENRWLMAGNVDTGITDEVSPRNVGAIGVTALQYTEREASDGRRLNDTIQTAEFLPLGTASGKQKYHRCSWISPLPSRDVNNTLPEDIDVYSFDLRAGDILDIAGLGAIGRFDVLYANGTQWFGTTLNTTADPDDPLFTPYPPKSPLMTLGNVVGAQVVPADGRYFVRVATSGAVSAYTLGLRVYRPTLESQPVGTQQILYLDFQGGIFPASLFGLTPDEPGTQIVIPSLVDSLNDLGFDLPAEPDDNSTGIANSLMSDIVDIVKAQFDSVETFGGNGNYNKTGIPGQFGIRY